MKCYKCKEEVPDSSNFCPKCGSPQQFTEELIRRAMGSDQAAITQLYYMTKDNVYYTIKTMISDEDLAQDLTQDTFLKAIRYLGQLREAAAFRGWIKKIARNMAIDVLRKRKIISFSQMVSADSEEAIEFEDDRQENLPEVVIDRQETTRLIGEILGTLSAEQRVVTELFYYENLSVKEIALELGVSENTVKSRLKYARNKIEIGVLDLEKKGTKLYSLAPIPFLLLLFRSQDTYAAELPDADILQAIQSGRGAGRSDGGQGFDGMDDSGREALNGETGSGADTIGSGAAKTGIRAAFQGMTAKIIAGIVATALIGGTILWFMAQNGESEPPAAQEEAVQPEERGEEAEPPDEELSEEGEETAPPEAEEETETTGEEEDAPLEEEETEPPEADNSEESRKDAYQAILDEYTEAAGVKPDEDGGGFEQSYGNQYPNVNTVIMGSFANIPSWNLCYAYYDIDGNGAEELLLGIDNGMDASIIDLYTFDGNNAVKSGNYPSSNFTIYDNGMIWESRLSGEETETGAAYIWEKITEDGYSFVADHEYISYYDNGNTLSFRDGEPITWEEFQDMVSRALESDAKVTDIDWSILVPGQS